MDLSNFKPYTVSAGVSTLTIGKGGVAFSKTAVIRLDKTPYVELLISDETHALAVRPVSGDDENATSFFRAGKKNIMVRWNYQDLLDRISDMMGWNLNETTYKVKGEYYAQQNTLVFELDQAWELKSK